MRCEKCGSEIPENSKFCNSCGAEQPQEIILTIDSTEIETAEVTEIPVESTEDPKTLSEEHNYFAENQSVKAKEKFYKKNWFVALMLLLFFPVGAYLMWKEKKFNKAVRIISTIILGLNFTFWTLIIIILLLPCPHEWVDATCTEPKTCSICLETEGEPLRHIKGEWKLTEEATLVHVGVEELFCERCNESLDSRGTEKKHPKVEGMCFNFTEDEFIDWIEDTSNLEFVLFETSERNTYYAIKNTETDDTGVLLLNHKEDDSDSNIYLIGMHMFDENLSSIAMVTYIGELIDSRFSSDTAFEKLYYDKTYTKASMTSTMLELMDDCDFAVLAPTEYFEYILE